MCACGYSKGTTNFSVEMFTRAQDFISFRYPLEKHIGDGGPRYTIISFHIGVVA